MAFAAPLALTPLRFRAAAISPRCAPALHPRPARLRRAPAPAACAAPAKPQKATPALPLAEVLRLALPEWRSLALGVLASLVTSGVMLLTPVAYGRVLDAAARGGGALFAGARWLLALYAAGAACRLAEVLLMRDAAERIVYSLRVRVFSALVRSDVATLDAAPVGDLLSRLSADTTALQRVLTDDVVRLLQGALEAAAAAVVLLGLSRRLGALVLASAPLSVGAGVLYGARAARVAREVSTGFARANAVAAEQLGGIRIVKSFAREGFAEARYAARAREVLRLGRAAARADAVLQGWNRLVASATTAAVLLLGGRLVAAGALSVGGLAAAVLYAGGVLAGLGKLSAGVGEAVRASGAADRVLQILGTAPSIERARGADIGYGVELDARQGALEFRDVWFRYPGTGRDVLRGASFTVGAGGSAAFVGGSGAGKSTALALVSRFYDPTAGKVLLDGRELGEYELRAVRERLVGIVSQEPYLIAGTIAENIAFGREDASRAEVEAAAAAAGVTEFAGRMEGGLNTTVARLSGGEQQRVMIARCLAKRPKVMVLDEPTSALDRRSEALVNETIERLIRDEELTVILISHRLATVRHCETIVVFEQGEVAEQGGHDELVQKDGAYCKLLRGVR